jgi:hypothetical protein
MDRQSNYSRDGQSLTQAAVNPAWVSQNMGNPILHAECEKLKLDYLAILEEASM